MSDSNRLRRLREASDLSKGELAAQFGVQARTIHRWERGETPIPRKHWEALSELFGVSVSYLLALDDGNGDTQRQVA